MVKTKTPKLSDQIQLPTSTKKKASKKSIITVVSDMWVGQVSDVKPNINMMSDANPQSSKQNNMTSDMEEEGTSLWQAISGNKNFPIMAISLLCSFLVSATFYWAGKLLMKIKFEDMFKEKLPRYQNLVYGIGSIQNIDVDRILLRDDLNDQHFMDHAVDGSILLDMQRILEEHRIMQSLTHQRTISPDEVLSKGDLDNAVFEFQAQTGHVTVDIDKVIVDNNLVVSTGEIQNINVDNVLMRDDLPPHIFATAFGKIEDLSAVDESFADGVIVFDKSAPKRFATLLKRKSRISPIKPIVIEVHDDCDMTMLGLFIKHFSNNVILDITNYHKDPDVFDQFTLPVMTAATMEG